MNSRTMERTMARWLAGVLLISSMGACSSISGTDRTKADEAQLIVDGTSAVPLQVITSTNFSTGLSPDGVESVSFVRADTLVLSLPIDRRFRINGSDRIHIAVRNPDATATATISMRILVDGREVFRQAASLRDAAVGFSYFLF